MAIPTVIEPSDGDDEVRTSRYQFCVGGLRNVTLMLSFGGASFHLAPPLATVHGGFPWLKVVVLQLCPFTSSVSLRPVQSVVSGQ